MSIVLSARRGIALLLTMVVVGLLSASTIYFMRMTHLEARVADNTYAYTQAEVLAYAGLRGAMTLLAMDDESYDGQTDTWARFRQYAAAAGGLFDEGDFTGYIEDQAALFNVNTLIDAHHLVDMTQLGVFERLLARLEIGSEPVAAILDWQDTDDEPRIGGGAEDSYYRTLDDPYPCANAPFNTVGELGRVIGVTPRILHGEDDQPGLSRFITVHGDGLININTAGEEILMSLDDDLTGETVREIMERRISAPFESLDDLKEVSGMTAPILARIGGILAVKSSCFLVHVEGRFRQATVPLNAVVYRQNGSVSLLYLQAG